MTSDEAYELKRDDLALREAFVAGWEAKEEEIEQQRKESAWRYYPKDV